MAKFRNKYRIASARAQWWDYGWNGAYFITICTKNRNHFFVVMPNHIHGILILNKPNNHDEKRNVGMNVMVSTVVETLRATSLQPSQSPQPPQSPQPSMASISPKSNSISTIIRSYKSAVTKHANRLGFANGWQARFHDHIIRNDAEYQRISDYIIKNPVNWKNDKFRSA